MFWKKKKVTVAPVVEGATAPTDTKPSPKVESPKPVKLPGPRPIPAPLEKHITDTCKMDASVLHFLKILVRKRPDTARAFDCRIYDPEEAAASEVIVKDYTSLDAHLDMVLYEGWYDEDSKKVELSEKRKVNLDVPLLTEAEILQKIEGLSQPGSSIFFYQNAGSAAGGPLGRGAAVVELNPDYGKKGKKYIVYTANVIGLEPSTKRNKLFDSDKPKEIAKWAAVSHKKRMY